MNDHSRSPQPRPIFVIGSPRSGTSILTWCLGQHPNILPLEESGGSGPFSVNVGVFYAMGCERGERSRWSALGVERAELFREFGDAIDRTIHSHRARLERNNRASARRNPQQVGPEFAVSRSDTEPKTRWVDGTPESSMYICGLNALFPGAKFVHILRDADDVAASLLAFRDGHGQPLVANADAAYAYWLRTVQACVLAEQALGAAVVHRLPYAKLVAEPEAAMRSVLEFLGETYVPTCVEPLNRCINSSFADETTRHDCPAATSASIDLARRFNVELHDGDPPAAPRAQFDAAFETNVRFARNLDGEYAAAQSMVASLQSERRAERVLTDTQIARQRKMLDACGVLLGVQLAAAIAAVIGGAERMPRDASAVWLTLAMIGVVVYAWLRRAGLCALSKHILGARKSARILDISFPERIDENTLVRPGKMQHMSKGAEVAGSAQDRA